MATNYKIRISNETLESVRFVDVIQEVYTQNVFNQKCSSVSVFQLNIFKWI